MSSQTNLVDSITHLRNRKKSIHTDGKGLFGKTPRFKKLSRSSHERRFATDFFMLFAYSLLGVTILAQFFLIFWLDII
jgi:hypothetical protein